MGAEAVAKAEAEAEAEAEAKAKAVAVAKVGNVVAVEVDTGVGELAKAINGEYHTITNLTHPCTFRTSDPTASTNHAHSNSIGGIAPLRQQL